MRIAGLLVVCAVLAACVVGSASAQREDPVSIAASLGVYMPTSSDTRDRFDDAWVRFGLRAFEPAKPEKWRFGFDAGILDTDGPTEALLIPITAGFERGFGQDTDRRPYVAIRAGTYYGSVEEPARDIDETKWGLNVNASAGIVFKQRFFVEMRYDVFSDIAGISFDGLSAIVGIRLFDL